MPLIRSTRPDPTQFFVSDRPYAVDPRHITWTQEPAPDGSVPGSARVRAFWYRRVNGVPTAFLGHLTARITYGLPLDWDTFREHCHAKTGAVEVDVTWNANRERGYGHTGGVWPAPIADILRPALASYLATPKAPIIPAGFDGWWKLTRPNIPF